MRPYPSNSGPETALRGLIVLGVAALIIATVRTASDVVPDSWGEEPSGRKKCMYHIIQDDRSLGTIFLRHPESISSILEALGASVPAGGAYPSSKIPCGSLLRVGRKPPTFSVERMPGLYLLCAKTRIDINTADAAQLCAAPGIGPALAKRIVHHRDEAGPFKRIEDLGAVPGIGAEKLHQLAPYLEAEGLAPTDRLQHVQTSLRLLDPTRRVEK